MIDRLIAKVKEVDTETWYIKFEVPELFSEITTYPEAIPLFSMEQEVCVDDVVCIFYNAELKDCFYYTKITSKNFVGLFNQKVEIDITDGENVIVNASKEIQLNGADYHLTMFEQLNEALNNYAKELQQNLDTYAQKLINTFNTHTHSCSVGPTTPPMSPWNEMVQKPTMDISESKAESLRTSGDSNPREEENE